MYINVGPAWRKSSDLGTDKKFDRTVRYPTDIVSEREQTGIHTAERHPVSAERPLPSYKASDLFFCAQCQIL